ncbi:hypothetical protein GCM10017586_16350 [Microbacterium imperiale]|uniref:Uncharacterized protein n=1 Tax=Microbacterium imperiale TaxID=33884 RepID=A0A9W6M3M9_9MICO|nr:hypothetical protein GCM10017544_18310 [Microbacterium imperiale]GLJ79952.1 hypothetical protein GCM10017586_16350 [Microbacterium imperiale]
MSTWDFRILKGDSMMASRRRRRRRVNAAPTRPPGSSPRWVYVGLALVALGAIALAAAALLTR